MAEKKFFVDINLQGSALTNATIGTNSSLTKAGSFGFDGTRLKYFDGTAIKDVANLSDISAVTGGLIFQGGYDPTTDTPDITDGTALKGFFWAATAAGTFLGESVQVGDSIVAKVDNAGATLADWLILQGNIVIATDSVDGISRLATQTEANDGTEGGAVVITPATLQGKIDAQIIPEISNKLPLAGGTLTGSLSITEGILGLGGGNITSVDRINLNSISSDSGNPIDIKYDLNFGGLSLPIYLAAPTDGGDATNKLYVDTTTSTAQANAEATAEAYADSLAPNYDAAGSAATAQANAEAYADSLAPNYDPAGAAATAETNANSYTDAEIAAQSFQIALVSEDWILNGSTYEANVTHNLNSSYPVVTFADGDNTTVELVYTSSGSNSIKVKSNILPINISVSLIAARP